MRRLHTKHMCRVYGNNFIGNGTLLLPQRPTTFSWACSLSQHPVPLPWDPLTTRPLGFFDLLPVFLLEGPAVALLVQHTLGPSLRHWSTAPGYLARRLSWEPKN